MMKTALLVAVGGAFGSLGRFYISQTVLKLLGSDFPWATLGINVAGSFLIGIAAGLVAAMNSGAEGLRLFAMVGVLGGFTTFSAFSLETLTLWERGAGLMAFAYIAASVGLSLVAAFGGMTLIRVLSP